MNNKALGTYHDANKALSFTCILAVYLVLYFSHSMYIMLKKMAIFFTYQFINNILNENNKDYGICHNHFIEIFYMQCALYVASKFL